MNIREILKNSGSYLVIGISLLGFIIMYGSTRAHEFNLYIFGTGALLMVPIVILLLIERFKSQPHPEDIKYILDLKQTGIRVPVDLTKCKIISNNWTIQKPEKTNQTILFNEITGNSHENQLTTDATLSRIQFTTLVNGHEKTFTSPTIAKDRTTLHFLCEIQKETSIYIDRDNSKYYFFDLDFLGEM
jgi:hypothetical protein